MLRDKLLLSIKVKHNNIPSIVKDLIKTLKSIKAKYTNIFYNDKNKSAESHWVFQ